MAKKYENIKYVIMNEYMGVYYKTQNYKTQENFVTEKSTPVL